VSDGLWPATKLVEEEAQQLAQQFVCSTDFQNVEEILSSCTNSSQHYNYSSWSSKLKKHRYFTHQSSSPHNSKTPPKGQK
jgi:hypothetical protein